MQTIIDDISAQQRGLIGPEMRQTFYAIRCLLCIQMYVRLLFWFLIIGHIPICVGTFLKLPKYRPTTDPQAPYVLQQYFNESKKDGNILRTY